MKVLFVGEGPNDVGSPSFAPRPSPVDGFVPRLARKLSPGISKCVGLFWREIPVLNREKRKRGFAAKVASAIVLAELDGCDGTICVTDQDGDVDRLPAMEEGATRGLRTAKRGHRTACGVAIESIEAWVLGVPTAVASVVGVEKDQVLSHYKLAQVEELNPRSGEPKKRSKDLLDKIAACGNQSNAKDSTPWREDIADAADIDELCTNCPNGFKPFAEKLQAAFGPR